MTKIATAVAAAATVLLGAVLWLAPAASAAVTPVMPDAHASGWTHMVRLPAHVEIGEGGSPYLTNLVWQYWDGTSAYATGWVNVMNPRCTPTYRCQYHPYSVKVWLHRVTMHHGRAVFSRMRWTYDRRDPRVMRFRLARGWWTPAAVR